jgi:hypothetical protein
MANPPTGAADVVNRALDPLGVPPISEMQEGSDQSNAALRHYGPTVRDLLRAAPWNFARKTRILDLMFDAAAPPGGVAASGVPAPPPPFSMVPWLYAYHYPQDCVRVRFVPQIAPVMTDIAQQPPPMTGMPYNVTITGQQPAPFVVTTIVELTAILTNVQGAQLVYTSAMFDPQQWDSLFMSAVVPLLGARLALALVGDKKLALNLRQALSAEAAAALNLARVTDGNEGWSTQDHLPDFMRVRGIQGWPVYGFPSGALAAWDPLSLPDGSAY